MAETHHTMFAGGGNVKMGTATVASGTVAVSTGFSTVLSAQATYAANPSTAVALYRTISGGTVTFCGGVFLIDYLIVGLP